MSDCQQCADLLRQRESDAYLIESLKGDVQRMQRLAREAFRMGWLERGLIPTEFPSPGACESAWQQSHLRKLVNL